MMGGCAQHEHPSTACLACLHPSCPAPDLTPESLLLLQDDAHIFCLPNQIGPEIGRVLDLTEDIMTAFGFEAEGFEVGTGTATLCQVPQLLAGALDCQDCSGALQSYTHPVCTMADQPVDTAGEVCGLGRHLAHGGGCPQSSHRGQGAVLKHAASPPTMTMHQHILQRKIEGACCRACCRQKCTRASYDTV